MPRTTTGPSMRDIAKALGLSIATVSRALNGHPRVSEAVREQVLRVAGELGYHPPVRSANGKRLEQVAFVVREGMGSLALNPFYSHVLAGAEAECHHRGLRLFYKTVPSGDRGAAMVSELMEPGTGILLVGHFEIDFSFLRERDTSPWVAVDNHIAEVETDSVLAANREGLRYTVEHLYSRGHRSFAFLGLQPHYTLVQRFRGFREALAELGLPFDPNIVRPSDLHPEAGYDAALTLLNECRGSLPTAICCSCDAVAVGAIRAATAAGLRVPEDLAVVGFDDIDMAAHITPSLTTVQVPKQSMGMMGVRRLVERSLEPQLPAFRTMLNVRLTVRESS